VFTVIFDLYLLSVPNTEFQLIYIYHFRPIIEFQEEKKNGIYSDFALTLSNYLFRTKSKP